MPDARDRLRDDLARHLYGQSLLAARRPWEQLSGSDRRAYLAQAVAVLVVVDAHRSPQCRLRGRCPEQPPPATERVPLLDPDEHAAARAIRSHPTQP